MATPEQYAPPEDILSDILTAMCHAVARAIETVTPHRGNAAGVRVAAVPRADRRDSDLRLQNLFAEELFVVVVHDRAPHPTVVRVARPDVVVRVREAVALIREFGIVVARTQRRIHRHRKHPRGENWRTLRERMERMGPRSTLPQDGKERKRDTRATCWPTAVVSSLGYLGV